MCSHHVGFAESHREKPQLGRPVRRGAKAIISSGARVVLVREEHSDGRSFWTLPGGGVRSRESPCEGLRRELLEELRCDSIVTDTVGTFWYSHYSTLDVASCYTVFLCSVIPPLRPVRSEGVLESKWVTPDNLPPKTIPQVRQLLTDRFS